MSVVSRHLSVVTACGSGLKGQLTTNNGHFEKFINGQQTTDNRQLDSISACPVKFFAKDSGADLSAGFVADLTGVVRRRSESNGHAHKPMNRRTEANT